jgi:hypothetical protein
MLELPFPFASVPVAVGAVKAMSATVIALVTPVTLSAYAAAGELTVATPPTYVHGVPASAAGHARPP